MLDAPPLVGPDSVLGTFMVQHVEELLPAWQKHVPDPLCSELSGVLFLTHAFSKEDLQSFAVTLPCVSYYTSTLGLVGWDAHLGVSHELEQLGRGKEWGARGPATGGAGVSVIAIRSAPAPGERRPHLVMQAGGAPTLADGALGHLVFLSSLRQAKCYEFLDSDLYGACAGGLCRECWRLEGQRWEEIDFVTVTALEQGGDAVFNVSFTGMLTAEPASKSEGRDMLLSLPPGYRPEFVGQFQCFLRGQNLYGDLNVEAEGLEMIIGQRIPTIGFVAGGEVGNRPARNPDGWNCREANSSMFHAGTTVFCCYAVRDQKGWTPQHVLPEPYKEVYKQCAIAAEKSRKFLPARKKPAAPAPCLCGCGKAATESEDLIIPEIPTAPHQPNPGFHKILRGLPIEACGVIGADACRFWVPEGYPNRELYTMSSNVDVVDVFISQVIRAPPGVDPEMFGLLKTIDTNVGATAIAMHLVGEVDCHAPTVLSTVAKLTFWVDRACVNQDDDAQKIRIIKDHLEDFLVQARFVLCILSPHYFTRLWCIFEFCCALAYRGDFSTIVIGACGMAWRYPEARGIGETIVNLSVQTAQCYDLSDRHIIEDKVQSTFNSIGDFEEFAKLAALAFLARDTLALVVDYQFRETWEVWCNSARRCGFTELEAAMRSFDIESAHDELHKRWPDSALATSSDERMARCNKTHIAKWFKKRVEPLIQAARERAVRKSSEKLAP